MKVIKCASCGKILKDDYIDFHIINDECFCNKDCTIDYIEANHHYTFSRHLKEVEAWRDL